jgi:hypothetical protein
MSRRTLQLALGLTLTVTSTLVGAYTLKPRWEEPNRTWYLENPGFTGPQAGTVAQQNAAIQAGAQTWGSQGCSPFTFNFAGLTTGQKVALDDTSNVMVRNASNGNSLASTYTWTKEGFLADFDMAFWAGTPIVGITGGGTTMSGGGVALGNFDGAGLRYIVTALDNWDAGNDYWRFAFGSGCAGGTCTFTPPQTVDAGGTVMSSSAVSLGDFNSDGRADVFLSGVDNWDAGNDYWRFRVGTACNATTGQCTWSPVQTLDSGATTLSGGGVAVTQLDGNPAPDVVLAGIDNWDAGDDYFRYRIGMNCTAAGVCTWSPVQTVPGNGTTLSSGGVAAGDLDGDGVPEVLISAIDAWDAGNDYFRYVIGTACVPATGACSWSPVATVAGDGTSLSGGGVALADLSGDGRPEVIVTAVDNWDVDLDYWRFRVGTGCAPATGGCAWGPLRTAPAEGAVVSGGGLVVSDLNGDGTQDMAFVGIDNWDSGDDYWRLRVERSCSATGICVQNNPFSTTNAPGTTDIEAVAVHEFGHAAGIDHTNTPPGAVMTCSIASNSIIRNLSCDDIEGLQQHYSATGVCGASTVAGVAGDVASMSGSAVAAGTFPTAAAVILAAVDNPPSANDAWRLSVGTGCAATGQCTWSARVSVPTEGAAVSSAGVALADFDADGRNDLLLSGIDNWDAGNDYFRFRIGTACSAGGQCTWSPIRTVDAGATTLSGGGVAIGQLDANPRPDVVLVGIDNWNAGNDYFRYRIGMNCDGQASCTWSPIQTVDAGGTTLSGGGVALADLDGNGTLELLVAALDNWNTGNDYFRYRVGAGCSGTSGQCTWSPIQTVAPTGNLPTLLCNAVPAQGVPNAALDLVGGGVSVAAGRRVLFSAIGRLPGHDDFRYVVGTGCNAATGACSWTPARITSSGGADLAGGGVTSADFDGDGSPDPVLAAIDQWDSGNDYWRVRVRMNPCGL